MAHSPCTAYLSGGWGRLRPAAACCVKLLQLPGGRRLAVVPISSFWSGQPQRLRMCGLPQAGVLLRCKGSVHAAVGRHWPECLQAHIALRKLHGCACKAGMLLQVLNVSTGLSLQHVLLLLLLLLRRVVMLLLLMQVHLLRDHL